MAGFFQLGRGLIAGQQQPKKISLEINKALRGKMITRSPDQGAVLSIKICRQLIADWDDRQFPWQGSKLAISRSHLREFINAHKLTDRCRSNNEVPRLIFSTFTEEKTRRRSCLPPIIENHKSFSAALVEDTCPCFPPIISTGCYTLRAGSTVRTSRYIV